MRFRCQISGGDGMRFRCALISLIITSGLITCLRIGGVVFSDDAILLSMAIVFAGALAGGD